MHKQSITSGLLFGLAVVGMSSVALGQAPAAQPNRPAVPQVAGQTMPAPVASVPMPNMPRPTTISPAAMPQTPVRQLPPALNPMVATPAHPQAIRPMPQVGGVSTPMPAQTVTVGVLPVSGQGQPSASPIATTTMPSGAPARLVAAQGVTADGQPVIVYLPPGGQTTANHPWPSGEFTYAPGTNVSSEVPDSFWPAPDRQPVGGMVERTGNPDGGGLFHWPKFARGNNSTPAPEVSRPPVRQKGIFNRTDESLFAAKESPESKTPEPPKAEPKALFGGGRSTPVVSRGRAAIEPRHASGSDRDPWRSAAAGDCRTDGLADAGSVARSEHRCDPGQQPGAGRCSEQGRTHDRAAGSHQARAAGSCVGLEVACQGIAAPWSRRVAEPERVESKEPVEEAVTETLESTPAAETKADDDVPAAAIESPLVQAAPAASEVAQSPAAPKSVLTKTEPSEDVRQRALLNRSLLNAPSNFITSLFTAPAPPGSGGSGRALVPGSASGPKSAERGPTPMPAVVAQAARLGRRQLRLRLHSWSLLRLRVRIAPCLAASPWPNHRSTWCRPRCHPRPCRVPMLRPWPIRLGPWPTARGQHPRCIRN